VTTVDPTRDPAIFLRRRLEVLEGLGVGVWPRFKPGEETHDGVILYRPNELVACKETTKFVRSQLRLRFGKSVRSVRRSDFTIFSLPEGVDSLDLAFRLKCPEANVSPHPVLNIAQGVPRIGPGDDPRPHTSARAPVTASVSKRFEVSVVDTGILKGLAGGAVAGAAIDVPDAAAPGQIIDWYGAAHGSFIDGIYRRHSPGVTVSHAKAVSNAGLVSLDSFVSATDDAVQNGADVLNLSLGMYAAPGLEIPGLKAAVRRWIDTSAKQGKELLIAAAAGNDSRSQRFYPAAFSDDPEVGQAVMAVGALDHRDENGEQRPAEFSNYGEWVNAWAPGVDLVSDYAGDGLEFLYGDNSTLPFHGCAQWSGTSFATPYAAAAVLRYADARPTSISARQAWHEIRDHRPWVLFD
jgi:hypothetical protein